MSRAGITPIVWSEKDENEKKMTTSTEMQSDKEDGEISDDPDVDYNILPRPVIVHEAVTVTAQSAIASNEINADRYSDEDEDQGSGSEDSDSDCDGYQHKKKRLQSSRMSSTEFRNPNTLGSMQIPQGSVGFNVTAGFEESFKNLQAKKRVNNVWGDVLREQEQDKTLQSLSYIEVGDTSITVDRGAETYTYTPGKTNPMKRKLTSKAVNDKKILRIGGEDLDVFGFDDEDIEMLKEPTDPSQSSRKSDPSNFENGFEATKFSSTDEVREMLFKKKGRDFVNFVANELAEPKKMLMYRAMKILGKKYCSALFINTLKIERIGGLLIKNKTRRRTPGGVFFYLLRQDNRIPVQQRNDVFSFEKKIVNQERKMAKAKKYRQNKQNMEQKLHAELAKGSEKMDEEDGECKSDNEASNDSPDDYCDSSDEMEEEPDVLEVSVRTNEFESP